MLKFLYVLIVTYSLNLPKIIMGCNILGQLVRRFMPVWDKMSWDERSLALKIPILIW